MTPQQACSVMMAARLRDVALHVRRDKLGAVGAGILLRRALESTADAFHIGAQQVDNAVSELVRSGKAGSSPDDLAACFERMATGHEDAAKAKPETPTRQKAAERVDSNAIPSRL